VGVAVLTDEVLRFCTEEVDTAANTTADTGAMLVVLELASVLFAEEATRLWLLAADTEGAGDVALEVASVLLTEEAATRWLLDADIGEAKDVALEVASVLFTEEATGLWLLATDTGGARDVALEVASVLFTEEVAWLRLLDADMGGRSDAGLVVVLGTADGRELDVVNTKAWEDVVGEEPKSKSQKEGVEVVEADVVLSGA